MHPLVMNPFSHDFIKTDTGIYSVLTYTGPGF